MPAEPAERPFPRLPPFKVQLALAGACAVLFVLWVRNEWLGPWATVVFVDVVSFLVPFAAALACLARARASPRELRAAWAFIGAATFAWGLGQVYWAVHELRTGAPPPTPSLADVGYLLLVPLAAIGTTLLVRRHGHGLDPRPLLDGAIVGSSFVFIAFAFGLEAIVLASEQTDLALIVNLLYPFGDGVVLGVALLRLSRAPREARGALGLLTAGFVLLAVADLWFLVVDAQGVYATGGILDAFWLLGFLAIALAATRPANLTSALDAPPQTTLLALVPLYPFLLAVAAAIYAELRDGVFSDTLFWTALVVILLVVGRLIVMLVDNFRLNDRLRAAQDVRTMMLNNITHDLVSPLSSVRIQMRLLRDDTLGPRTARQDNALAIVDRNVERVNRLSADLKDTANLEGNGLVLVPAPLDLADEARRAAASFEAEAKERGVRLVLDGAASVPLVGDAGRLGQVLDNLLSNALKFTPKDGRVTVTVAGGAAATLQVQDTGRGLDPDELARLFQPFSQVHRPGEVKERGTGLGLYISRGIAQAHGGTLVAASAGKGTGSTFTLTLPAAPPRRG